VAQQHPDPQTRLHQIGEVAEIVGLSLRTIRYYEEVELVPPSGRSSGGFRLYTAADVERFRMVKAFKPLKLTLDQMRDLLALLDRLDAGASLTAAEARRLDAYAVTANARTDLLREQLDAVEQLAAVLRRRARTASPKRKPR
jgi:DNA-binding transcriptional MerR regulator